VVIPEPSASKSKDRATVPWSHVTQLFRAVLLRRF
jgi:hypothetical protein